MLGCLFKLNPRMVSSLYSMLAINIFTFFMNPESVRCKEVTWLIYLVDHSRNIWNHIHILWKQLRNTWWMYIISYENSYERHDECISCTLWKHLWYTWWMYIIYPMKTAMKYIYQIYPMKIAMKYMMNVYHILWKQLWNTWWMYIIPYENSYEIHDECTSYPMKTAMNLH